MGDHDKPVTLFNNEHDILPFMQLEALRVIHRKKPTAPGSACAEALHFDSCQRELWVTDIATPLAGEVYSGEQAYRFLLLVATGLESLIAGETDVFGQLKTAWKAFEATPSRLARELAPWMRKLFEDTKEIRARHLTGMGGASYGSLVRRLLNAHADDTILLVGAGSLARSVAPFLTGSKILIVNRTPEFARALAQRLGARVALDQQSWAAATHAVICIPLGIHGEEVRRVSSWQMGNVAGRRRTVVHLGCRRGEAAGTWEREPGFHTLDDLFELREQHSETRQSALHLARQACVERARLRTLGGSLWAAHGWEDLIGVTPEWLR